MKAGTRRWIVREGDGVTVRDILARMKEDAGAIAEGRVFIGKKRVTSDGSTVKPGDEVRVGRAEARATVTILADRKDLLAVLKPAGIPTVPDRAGSAHSLVAIASAQTGRRDLRVTSRLDREVSGVVVFAVGDAAEERLKRAREEGAYARRYVAIAKGALPDRGVWDAPIGEGKDALHRAANGPHAKPSRTRFRVVARSGEFALLAVDPETGRTHQIRVHASHAGAPLLGDRDYGGVARVTLAGGKVVALDRVALHAARVTVPEGGGAALTVLAEVPSELRAAWTALGGDASAWDEALR